VDPRNLRVEKIEHLRVSDGIDTAADLFTSEFFDRRVVGYKWKGLSCRPKIVGHLKCLEDTATGDNFKPLLVATPIGLLSLTYRRAGLLVKVIAAVVDPKVVPITSGLFMSLDEPDFITATVGYCDDRNQSAS
jgi:hypothetical protein